MTWSLGEIRSLSQKAAKGAGMPWGLAEEAGFSVQWLEERNAPGLLALACLLQEIDKAGLYQPSNCPIGNGAWMSDTGVLIGNFPITMRQPLLIVPFLSNTLTKRIIDLLWDGNIVRIASDYVELLVNNDITKAGEMVCDIRLVSANLLPEPRTTRIPFEARDTIRILEGFAAKTYAPASEESRLAGAGAGTNDND